MALLTDGRFSGATRGMCIGYACPEAAAGGPIGLIEDGDIIRIDAVTGTINVNLTKNELKARRKNWSPTVVSGLAGALQKYASNVGQANMGAVTHMGNVQWEREN